MPDPTHGIDTVDPDPAAQIAVSSTSVSKTYNLDQPILTLSNGLALRHHRHSDAPRASKYGNNPKVARNMTNRWPYPYTIDNAHDWIATCRNETNWRSIGPTDPKSNNSAGVGQKLPSAWAITLHDEFVGGIGCQFQTDVNARRMSFGYWLAEEHWRKGIMSIVLPAFLEWVLEQYPWIVKLEASVYAWNTASAQLLTKCGFELEGRQKCATERFGKLCDELHYGLVREGVVATTTPPYEEE